MSLTTSEQAAVDEEAESERVPWRRRVAGLALIALAIAMAAHALRPGQPAEAATASPVTFAGGALTFEQPPEDHARSLATAFLKQPVRIEAGEHSRTLTRAEMGATVDEARLASLLREAADPGSALHRLHRQVRGEEPLPLPIPATLDAERAAEWLLPLKATIDRAALDARFDPSTGRVTPEVDGRRLHVWATLDRLDAALDAGASTVTSVIDRTAARRRASELADLRVDALLGEFETRYSTLEDARNRTHNLRVAASKLNGTVLLPGETLDFNARVGERSRANGYRPATVIADGELVDGMGGGACQVAGTLHAAAFFAGLTVLERHPHSRPSTYIKLGLDAAVSYPSLNLRLRNDLSFPVLIQLSVNGGVTQATVHGQRREQEVSFVRRVDEVLPYEEREVEAADLPQGVRVLSQRGVPGFKLTRWRIFRQPDTGQAIRHRDEDSYPPTTQLWRVGTGAPPPRGTSPQPAIPTSSTAPTSTRCSRRARASKAPSPAVGPDARVRPVGRRWKACRWRPNPLLRGDGTYGRFGLHCLP